MFQEVVIEAQRPCVIFKPRLYLDGDKYCALLGDDIMSGCVGFGSSPAEAMTAFDKAFIAPLNQPNLELTHLHEEVSNLKNANDFLSYAADDAISDLKALREENEKLREALNMCKGS